MTRKSRGLVKRLATLALCATLLAACGSTRAALSGTTDNGQHSAVIRDPENPYWGLSNTGAATDDVAIVPVRGPR